MVNLALHTLAVMSLSALVMARPDAKGTTAGPFTFAQWIEDIIADPHGDHLSPEEAVAAKNAAVAANPLEKRVWCDQNLPRANADDAAWCVQHLATLGGQGVSCDIGAGKSAITMCIHGNSVIVSSKSTSSAEGANCNDVARTGGLIFDNCWRSDGTVMGSEICITNNMFQVNIAGAAAAV